jgi:hypothetical protein
MNSLATPTYEQLSQRQATAAIISRAVAAALKIIFQVLDD